MSKLRGEKKKKEVLGRSLRAFIGKNKASEEHKLEIFCIKKEYKKIEGEKKKNPSSFFAPTQERERGENPTETRSQSHVERRGKRMSPPSAGRKSISVLNQYWSER